ncbi:signal peptidase I [Xylanimonas ulmi]|uniref:signal peptidase I n=1 Tax=Xylanimonas ulmi TaxID=228973 RepID=UPI0013EEBC0F|nr:signal peptidase I [Xylanibacterium ulmi]
MAAAVGVVVIVLALAVVVLPRVVGGTTLTVLSGSMEPVLSAGDAVVVRDVDPADVCAQVRVGQVLTYLPRPGDPELVTHRVVGKSVGTFDDGTDCRLVTQGDANSAVDEPVSPAQVRGVAWFAVPGLGWARQWVGEHVAWVAAGVVLAACLAATTTRRPVRRVLTVPAAASGSAREPGDAGPVDAVGLAGAVGLADGGGLAGDTAPVGAAALASVPCEEVELRVRELAVREREVAVRERELALRERDLGWEHAPRFEESPGPRPATTTGTAPAEDAP